VRSLVMILRGHGRRKALELLGSGISPKPKKPSAAGPGGLLASLRRRSTQLHDEPPRCPRIKDRAR
jgi:hypothetical protein